MNDEQNKREFTRAPIHVDVRLTPPDGIVLRGRVANVSMNGLRFPTDQPLPVGTECAVELVLDGGEGRICIQATGKVVRVDGAGMSIEFSAVDGDSLEHLRSVVLYNSPDQRQTEEEFASHIGLKRREP